MAGRRRKVRAKRFEPVPFLDLPGDIEAIHAAHARNEQGTAKPAAGELARDDLCIQLTAENVVDVVLKNTTACAVTLIGFLGKKGLRFEEMRRLDNGGLELLMLKSMQRVVMHENADGALSWQVMRRVIQNIAEMLAATARNFRVGKGV
jgi:hypothetical protein